MTRPAFRGATAIAATLCLAACTVGNPGLRTNQNGPLTIGGDDDGPTWSNICGQLPPNGAKVNFAGTIENPTQSPATIRAVELVTPVNVSVGAERAWDLRKSPGQVYWSAEQAADDAEYKKLFSVLEPAAGYVVDPGMGAGVAVQGTVASTGADVTVGRLLVRYTLDGTEYAELSAVDYLLTPGGCGP